MKEKTVDKTAHKQFKCG